MGGETDCALRYSDTLGSTPGVGGETIRQTSLVQPSAGLPPRGRGNPLGNGAGRLRTGSTPAWAGKPPTPEERRLVAPVYPRVGGETQATPEGDVNTSGLPPRGRGNPPPFHFPVSVARSTPAWAGKPCVGHVASLVQWVYPRVGGETVGDDGDHRILCRSTPAWAGKPAQRVAG